MPYNNQLNVLSVSLSETFPSFFLLMLSQVIPIVGFIEMLLIPTSVSQMA